MVRHLVIITLTLFVVGHEPLFSLAAGFIELPADPGVSSQSSSDIQTIIGTTGGVHILADPGELIVEVEKRDLNEMGAERELRAILVGPDRQVVAEKRIPDDGRSQGSGMGPPQRIVFQAEVERQGVYSLNITVSGGRMNTDVVWGFRTNSERFLIESARGHRDAAHEEPIIARNPEVSTDVWFWSRDGAFDIEVTELPESIENLSIYDNNGNKLQTLNATGGEIYGSISGTKARENRPWRLFFPKAYAIVHIDGVTRWSDEGPYRHLSFWSTQENSWFPCSGDGG